MNKFNLKPIDENIIIALENDLLNRNQSLVYFINTINSFDYSTSISLDGDWGSGKTFFVKQAKLIINSFNKNSEINEETKNRISSINCLNEIKNNNSIAVYYDAWINDNDDDPIISLIYEICMQLNEDYKIDGKSTFERFKPLFERLCKKDLSYIQSIFENHQKIQEHIMYRNFETNNKKFLSELLNEKANKLIIFIDELDRCKPTYAIRLLERVKHYFEDDRIVFVFSTNISQLQHTVKQYYGKDYDAQKYLSRFFDINVNLPQANINEYFDNISSKRKYAVEKYSKRIIDIFNFELREINSFYQNVLIATDKVFTSNEFNNLDDGKHMILYMIVPLLIGLKIHDISLYNEFINGNNSEPLKQLLIDDQDTQDLENFLKYDEYITSNFINKNGVKISKEEIIERIYNLIFCDRSNNDTTPGKRFLGTNPKQFALMASSMISNFVEVK